MVHLRALFDAGDLAVAHDVPEVCNDLGPEGDDEPDRVHVLQPVPDVVEPGDLAQGEERRERQQRGGHEEDERLDLRLVDLTLGLDVQETQGRILR